MADNENNDSPGVTVEPEPAKPQGLTIRIDQPDSYVYSNVAGITITPWDVRLNFADVNAQDGSDLPPNTTAGLTTKAVAGIVMPPEHAAGLALLLVEQLKLFETQFGDIRHRKWADMRESTKASARQQENPAEDND